MAVIDNHKSVSTYVGHMEYDENQFDENHIPYYKCSNCGLRTYKEREEHEVCPKCKKNYDELTLLYKSSSLGMFKGVLFFVHLICLIFFLIGLLNWIGA